MQKVKLTNDFHRQSVENDNPANSRIIYTKKWQSMFYVHVCYSVLCIISQWCTLYVICE